MLVYGIMFILILAIIQFTILTTSASNSLNIFPPGGKPYGLSYSEHIQNFWKWLLAIPADSSPIDDATGEKCSTDQTNTNSAVFYLVPTDSGSAHRTCKVPVGKALFIPVMPESLNEKESPGSSVKELAEAAKNEQDRVNSLNLKIDNIEYRFENLSKYRAATEPFEVTIPTKGSFGIQGGGNSKAVADGFYIITGPLAKGNHTLQYSSSLGAGSNPDTDPAWAQDVTYKIIVK